MKQFNLEEYLANPSRKGILTRSIWYGKEKQNSESREA